MEDYKIFKSKLILENTEVKDKFLNLNDTKSVVEFAKDTLKIDTYPEEVVFALCLNPTNQYIHYFELSRGTLSASYIGIKELMKRVLISNAYGFILIHNHPCGEAKPSQEDINITLNIANAARVLDIKFYDHIVIGQNGYSSISNLLSKENENAS